MKPTIRPALPEDAEAVAHIYVESWNAGFQHRMQTRTVDDDLVARWRTDLNAPFPHRWWVAVREDTIAGFIGIGPSRDPVDPALCEINTIAVLSAHWRLGIGRSLMATALAHLVSDGYNEAIVWTLEDYPLGQKFYASAGWERDGGSRDSGRQIRYRINIQPPSNS